MDIHKAMAQLPFNPCQELWKIYIVFSGISLNRCKKTGQKTNQKRKMANELQISPTYLSIHGRFLHTKLMLAYTIICAYCNDRRSS